MKFNKLLNWLAEERLDSYLWLIEDDKETFMKKRLKLVGMIVVLLLLIVIPLLYFTNSFDRDIIIFGLMGLFMVAYMTYKIGFWRLKSLFKSRRGNVYKAFPLWVSTLEILIVTNNIPNTFRKSLATCPASFRDELEVFVNRIQYDPENKEFYKDFLSKYNIDEVNEIIMDMYAFNKLNKSEIIVEFKNLNKRLNKMASRIRQNRQQTDLFFISALNCLPLFGMSIYILLISMMINVATNY